jgi:hypothetical protein
VLNVTVGKRTKNQKIVMFVQQINQKLLLVSPGIVTGRTDAMVISATSLN